MTTPNGVVLHLHHGLGAGLQHADGIALGDVDDAAVGARGHGAALPHVAVAADHGLLPSHHDLVPLVRLAVWRSAILNSALSVDVGSGSVPSFRNSSSAFFPSWISRVMPPPPRRPR